MIPADPRDRIKGYVNDKRKELLDEANHIERIKRVFGSEDGIVVLDWLLSDLCQFWAIGLDATNIGQFQTGRSLFNFISMADATIANALLDRRRQAVDMVRREDKKRVEKLEKELI
jgi:hypothetical protein